MIAFLYGRPKVQYGLKTFFSVGNMLAIELGQLTVAYTKHRFCS